MPTIHTVLGPIDAARFGFALVHEHVMCDFIGADHTGPFRWDVDEIVRTMLPSLVKVKERGVSGFVDCTPIYIGREVRVLRELARRTGLHILTNTGYYGAAGDKYLTMQIREQSPEQMAAHWIREWEDGIDGTGVRPGFIKIGVDGAKGEPPRLSDVDGRIVRAAARAQRRTGLVVASHTGQGAAALEQIRLFREEGADPGRLIIVHCDAEPAFEWHAQAAAQGAWIEYDGIGSKPVADHVALVRRMLDLHADRLLISMDAGWYNVGVPAGGKIRDYNFLTDEFLPALRKSGTGEAAIRRLTVENPARAFARVE